MRRSTISFAVDRTCWLANKLLEIRSLIPRSCLAVALIYVGSSVAVADGPPKSLLIMGAGNTGSWNTELLIANPTNQGLDIQVGGFPGPIFCTAGCPPPDPIDVGVPANGQITIQFSDVFSGFGMQFLYVLPRDQTDPLPVVRARAYQVAQPARAMELPITSYGALAARSNSPLDFPGAERSSTAHSNLIIAEVTQASGATARIDAITTDGTTVATKNVNLFAGQNLFLVDVLNEMGVDNFSGHVRVTYTGGGGIIDGALATLTSDGGFAVSAGFNP